MMFLKWGSFLLVTILIYVLPSLCFSQDLKDVKKENAEKVKAKGVQEVNNQKENGKKLKDQEEAKPTKRGQIAVTAYGGVGYTLNTGVDDISNQNIDIKSADKINYNFGLQASYELGSLLNIGGDIGYSRVYGQGDGYNYDVLYILLLSELKVFDSFYFQVGIGPYIGIGDQKGAPFGIMLAAGYDINITSFLAVPILLRSDFIFDDQAVVPLSLKIGLKFKF